MDESLLRQLAENKIWATQLTTVGRRLELEPPVNISNARFIGDCYVGAYSFFSSGIVFNTTIGRYCSFANGVIIGEGDHPISWLTTHPFPSKGLSHFDGLPEYQAFQVNPECRLPPDPPISIGNDVWMGRDAFIKPGLKIGDGAVVGARAVVTRDVPAYAIVAGVPARIIRYRFPDDCIERLLSLRWWRFSISDIEGISFTDVSKAVDQIEQRLAAGQISAFEPARTVLEAR